MIAFARHEQIDLFARFPEVVLVDGTHGTNREKYVMDHLYPLLLIGTCYISSS